MRRQRYRRTKHLRNGGINGRDSQEKAATTVAGAGPKLSNESESTEDLGEGTITMMVKSSENPKESHEVKPAELNTTNAKAAEPSLKTGKYQELEVQRVSRRIEKQLNAMIGRIRDMWLSITPQSDRRYHFYSRPKWELDFKGNMGMFTEIMDHFNDILKDVMEIAEQMKQLTELTWGVEWCITEMLLNVNSVERDARGWWGRFRRDVDFVKKYRPWWGAEVYPLEMRMESFKWQVSEIKREFTGLRETFLYGALRSASEGCGES